MGDSECEHGVPGEGGKLCEWVELYAVSDRVVHEQCWDTDELYGVWQWNDYEWSGKDKL